MLYIRFYIGIKIFLIYLPFFHEKQADADGNGTIDYGEFITATMHMNRMDREEHLYTAFTFFDKDSSG
jgi:Ca2+-binding EF-hand superfamily protein